MSNYGFVINNRTCIGCHACSTACKSENEVPLGVYRTWVKYTESGTYPDTRRSFQVTRCNHCANPPCVRICPVTAMYQRHDGIVEFDSDVCIGCKACMQACPYDAIHIDPDSGTAAKCHFCAHRTDLGLEPACVVVCPEHAIIAGDLDDPNSEISQVLAKESVSVRKPEQGTAPKLFYIEGNDIALTPTATETSTSFMWADVLTSSHEPEKSAMPKVSPALATAHSGTAIRAPQPQGHPTDGPIQYAPGRMAEHMVQVGYNAQHVMPWHWPVPAYLVTKAFGTGMFLLFALGTLAGLFPHDATASIAISLASLGFLGLTTFFLVYDLERPERFLRVVLRPQWGSWLVRGAFLLIGFSGLVTAWFGLELAASFDLLAPETIASIRAPILWIGLPLAIGAAVYTAFLFGQAEGRDLWQSPLLPIHLLVQALMMGGAGIALLDLAVSLPEGLAVTARWTLVGMLVMDLVVTFLGEFGMPHASEVAARAAHDIRHGRYRHHFWVGHVLVGHMTPLILLAWTPHTLPLAGLLAALGLYAFEYAYVMAPQHVPNS